MCAETRTELRPLFIINNNNRLTTRLSFDVCFSIDIIPFTGHSLVASISQNSTNENLRFTKQDKAGWQTVNDFEKLLPMNTSF